MLLCTMMVQTFIWIFEKTMRRFFQWQSWLDAGIAIITGGSSSNVVKKVDLASWTVLGTFSVASRCDYWPAITPDWVYWIVTTQSHGFTKFRIADMWIEFSGSGQSGLGQVATDGKYIYKPADWAIWTNYLIKCDFNTWWNVQVCDATVVNQSFYGLVISGWYLYAACHGWYLMKLSTHSMTWIQVRWTAASWPYWMVFTDRPLVSHYYGNNIAWFNDTFDITYWGSNGWYSSNLADIIYAPDWYVYWVNQSGTVYKINTTGGLISSVASGWSFVRHVWYSNGKLYVPDFGSWATGTVRIIDAETMTNVWSFNVWSAVYWITILGSQLLSTSIHYDDWTRYSDYTKAWSTTNNASAYQVVGSSWSYMQKEILWLWINDNIEITLSMMSGVLWNFFFFCNSSWAWNMFRLETRAGSVSWLASTTWRTARSWPTGWIKLTSNIAYTIKITVIWNTATVYYNGTYMDSQTITRSWTYIWLVWDWWGWTTTYDDIRIKRL